MKKKGKIAFYVFMLVFILIAFGCNQANLEKEEGEVDMSEQDDNQPFQQQISTTVTGIDFYV